MEISYHPGCARLLAERDVTAGCRTSVTIATKKEIQYNAVLKGSKDK
jgi:hypothetical protein